MPFTKGNMRVGVLCAMALSLSTPGCKSRGFNPPAQVKRDSFISSVLLEEVFSSPARDANGTPFVTVKSPDVVVFSYTSKTVAADRAWEQVEASVRPAQEKLSKILARVARGELKPQDAHKALLDGSESSAGPGLYLAPNSHVSADYGPYLVVSCLAPGTRIALDAITLDETNSHSLGTEYPVVAYQWYKGIALVVRESSALNKNSTFAFNGWSTERDPDIQRFASTVGAGTCAPVRELLSTWRKWNFEAAPLAYEIMDKALIDFVAFREALKERIPAYLAMWPAEADFDGEIIRFAEKSPEVVAYCLYRKWKGDDELKRDFGITLESPLGDGKGPCPYGPQFASSVSKLGDFDVKSDPESKLSHSMTPKSHILASMEKARTKIKENPASFLAADREFQLKNDSTYSKVNLLFGGHPAFVKLSKMIKDRAFDRFLEWEGRKTAR